MKNCGITRNVDELGRIVLPKELRTILGIDPGTPLEIYTEEDYIILKKYTPRNECCVFCGSEFELISFKSNYICRTCKADITE